MYQQVTEGQKVGGGKPSGESQGKGICLKKAPKRTERTKQSTEQSKKHKKSIGTTGQNTSKSHGFLLHWFKRIKLGYLG